MNTVEYIRSEYIWRGPEFKVGRCSLGAAILDKLKQSDPERIFEVHHDSGTNVTVGQIRHQTITVAQNLLNLGVKKNDRVVFFTMLNLKITPLAYACYTIGAPLCFFETYLEQEHVPGYLEMLDPSVIIYEERFKPMIVEGLKDLNLTNLRHMISLDGDCVEESVNELLFGPVVDIENFQAPDIGNPWALPAILGFTSATTGLPKIIMNSHALVIQSVFNYWKANSESVVMVLSEIRWCCQQTIMIQPALLGAKRIYSSTPPLELTGEFVRNIIDTHKVTHYFEVPRFIRTVFEAAECSKDPSTLSSLKYSYIGGEGVGDAFSKYVAKITPRCKIIKSYGMTEVAGTIASAEEVTINKTVNGGLLESGFMLKLLDSDGSPLGPNQIGRVHIKSSGPFLGYLKNEHANKETFIEGGWLDTGDLGTMDSDNLLDIFTREKYTLKYADGKLLIPNSIENIVSNFDGVHSSALVGNPSVENPKQYCGTIFVVLQSGTDADLVDFENNFRAYLRRELSKDQLEIVKYFKVIDDLPKTSCFKVNRMALKKIADGGYAI